jgi:hypothetical protein
MGHRILETQPQKLRGVFSISADLAVAVFDDSDLIEDDAYAPGVMKDLKRAWDKGDYFNVVAYNKSGEQTDSVSSMAGYGGPKAAAEAAVKAYFGG